MGSTEKLLKDYTDEEKGAYIGAIASIATADHVATDDEIEFLRSLAEGADLSKEQEDGVVRAASEISGEELSRCLSILKNSDLRFSLIADIISFAKADDKYSEEEKSNIEEIARHLDIDQKQFSLLDLFVKKSSDSNVSVEEVSKPGFLSALGLDDKLQKAGINTSSLMKGLLGIVGPLLLTRMLTGGRSRSMAPNRQGGLFGNAMSQGGLTNRQPGIGSLISLLSGGRGYSGMGNILPNILQGRR